MSDLDFEQRHRLEAEVLPAVISDPEYAASTIVRLDAEIERLRTWIENVATESQLDQPVPALGGTTGRQFFTGKKVSHET